MTSPPLSAFSQWAHDPARTVDERYLVWLLCSITERKWFWNLPEEERKGRRLPSIDFEAHNRLNLNRAIAPDYSQGATERAAAMTAEIKEFKAPSFGTNPRPIRDAGALRFFPALETVEIEKSEISDLSWIRDLPRLRRLTIHSGELSDLSPLADAGSLISLHLLLGGSGFPLLAPPLLWPDAAPIGKLTGLEVLHYWPNAAALEGLSFPALREASLTCAGQRDCRCLPEMPAVTVLKLGGVESLGGINRFPRLRNLSVDGALRDFGDLPALRELTSLKLSTSCGWPRDVSPLATLPELRIAEFTGEVPRNYWPLAAAPKLREISAHNAVGISLDIQAINAALSPWDADFLAPEPRTMPPLRIGTRKNPFSHTPPYESPDPAKLCDPELFYREIVWMERRCRERLNQFAGHEDGVLRSSSSANVFASHRSFSVTLQTQDLADRLPEVIDIIRGCLADSPHDWWVNLSIHLRVPDHLFTKQQKRWIKQIEERYGDVEDDFDVDRYQKTQQHLIETAFRQRSAEEEGEAVEPDDFVPPPEVGPTGEGPRQSVPEVAGSGREDDGAETPEEFRLLPFDEQEQGGAGDDGSDDGDIGVKIDPSPPEWFIEDPNAHPLAAC